MLYLVANLIIVDRMGRVKVAGCTLQSKKKIIMKFVSPIMYSTCNKL